MNAAYGRDLDLNLFRVLVAVADTGSVTAAAAQLYLTQPAISAALRRLSASVGAQLLARHGRGVVLTERGALLVADVRPHLEAMIQVALEPPRFDPRTSDRIVRIGLADAADEWLLPPLLRLLEREAPRLRLICLPVQFRTVAEALATRRVDLAVTVADELPASILRQPPSRGGFVCLFDPRFAALGSRPTERAYFAHEHVIVSYNGDLRGIIEDSFGRERRVRCSVASFSCIGAIVEGGPLVATVPEIVAFPIVRQRPQLRTAPLPFDGLWGGMDLLWPAALDADVAGRLVREALARVANEMASPSGKRKPTPRRAARARPKGSPLTSP
jgi:LysR family transcriptional activator of mexEF-oprN operon